MVGKGIIPVSLGWEPPTEMNEIMPEVTRCAGEIIKQKISQQQLIKCLMTLFYLMPPACYTTI